MAFSGTASDDVSGGGGFISEPGTYHLVITQVYEGEGKKKKDGTRAPIDGFTVDVEALAGTVNDCQGTKHSETLFMADPTKGEKSQLANRRAITAFLIATGLITPDQLGKPFSVELEAAIGKQVVMKLVHQLEKDGNGNYTVATKFLQMHYSDVYHVDDPTVAAVPKNADAIGMIDPSDRHDETWFAWKKASPASNSNAAASNAAAKELDSII